MKPRLLLIIVSLFYLSACGTVNKEGRQEGLVKPNLGGEVYVKPVTGFEFKSEGLAFTTALINALQNRSVFAIDHAPKRLVRVLEGTLVSVRRTGKINVSLDFSWYFFEPSGELAVAFKTHHSVPHDLWRAKASDMVDMVCHDVLKKIQTVVNGLITSPPLLLHIPYIEGVPEHINDKVNQMLRIQFNDIDIAVTPNPFMAELELKCAVTFNRVVSQSSRINFSCYLYALGEMSEKKRLGHIKFSEVLPEAMVYGKWINLSALIAHTLTRDLADLLP